MTEPVSAEPDMTAIVGELEAKLAKATPGPWQLGWENTVCSTVSTWAEIPLASGWMEDAWIKDNATDESKGNAALIIAAVNALSALLAERTALLARAEALEGALGEVVHQLDIVRPRDGYHRAFLCTCALRAADAALNPEPNHG